ncbi:MAG: hypothetical protein AAB392_01805 [Patescibacteria group bacterium]
MIASSINGLGVSPALETASIENKVENKAVKAKPLTAEEYVRNYFSDIPVMVEVAKCESRFRHYNSAGSVLRGEINYLDRGVMQINEHYHSKDAEKLGFDLLSIEGNTAYARYIFEKDGVRPWKSSSYCWGKTLAYNDFIVNRSE